MSCTILLICKSLQTDWKSLLELAPLIRMDLSLDTEPSTKSIHFVNWSTITSRPMY